MKAGLQCGFCDLKMCSVRRCNGNSLDAVFSLGFFGKHGFVVGIASVFCNVKFSAECFSSLWINVECSGGQLKVEVSKRRGTVNITDLAALSSADHRPADWFVYFLLSVIHGFYPPDHLLNPTLLRYVTLSFTSRRLVSEFLGSRSCSMVIYPLYPISSRASLIPG